MLEPRQDLDLDQEALSGRADDDLGAQDLDRDGTVVLAVARQVHHRHSATAQHSIDRVTVTQRERLENGLVPAGLHAGKLTTLHRAAVPPEDELPSTRAGVGAGQARERRGRCAAASPSDRASAIGR